MTYFDPTFIVPISQTFSPVIQGATDNPTVTYTKQNGVFRMYGKLCSFDIEIITSSLTKTTLADAMRISLPTAAAASPLITRIKTVQCENTLPVKVGAAALIAAGDSFLTIQQSTSNLLGPLTYALLTGIGVLTNVITIRVGGSYETA